MSSKVTYTTIKRLTMINENPDSPIDNLQDTGQASQKSQSIGGNPIKLWKEKLDYLR